MSNAAPTISIPVDVTNPGQFFACCGLFELADRLWPGAEAWFEGEPVQFKFQIATPRSGPNPNADEPPTLHGLLTHARNLQFDLVSARNSEATDEDDDTPLDPIVIQSPIRLVLDWWSDKSIKPWAGSMNERLILNAMLKAIDPTNANPMSDTKAVFDPPAPSGGRKRAKKAEKKEPFYFDCRRGSNAHPLDSGFSPDANHMKSCCFPVVEAMCFVGLQRARPAPTIVPNQSTYTVWTSRLPVNAIGPVVCGMAGISHWSAFTFDNFFRTDQRKHKSYSRATRTRTNNV